MSISIEINHYSFMSGVARFCSPLPNILFHKYLKGKYNPILFWYWAYLGYFLRVMSSVIQPEPWKRAMRRTKPRQDQLKTSPVAATEKR